MSNVSAARSGLTRPTTSQTEHLAHWKALALEKMPYFASILYSLRPLDAPGLGTFAVDDSLRLYIDFEAVQVHHGLTPEQCAQALLHEASHVWRNHVTRARENNVTTAEREIANIAADVEINDDLVAAGCGWLGEFGFVPANINQPDGQTYEFYLARLREHVAKHQQAMCGSCGKPMPQQGQGQQGQGQQGQGQQGQGQQGQGQQGQGTCPGCGQDPGPFTGCGSISGGLPAPCELPASDDLDGQAPAASEVEKEAVLVRTAAAIVEHSRSRGTAPGTWVEEAELMLAPPQVPWQQVLSTTFRRGVAKMFGRRRTSYTRRNRRRHDMRLGGTGERIVYPGRYTPKLGVLFARDTSGSMSADWLNAVGSEVVAVARAMHIKGKHLRVMDVDAQVHTVKPYRDVTTLREVSGRGGTDMGEAIRVAAEDLDDTPDVMIVGTDGYTPWPQQPVGFPVIACIIAADRVEAERLAANVPDWISTVQVVMDEGEARAA